MGRRKKNKKGAGAGAAGSAGGALRQASAAEVGVTRWPLLKQPVSMVGEKLDVPGSFWGTSATRGQKDKMYSCTVVDFTLLHVFSPTQRGAAFKLVEMGEDGSGGVSEDFWMAYPDPFLKYYYEQHPEKLRQAQEAAAPITPVARHGDETAAAAVDLEDDVPKKTPETTTRVYDYLKQIRTGKNTKGRLFTKYRCVITNDRKKCCASSVTLYGKSTGPFFKHVRCKARAGDTAHKEVLELLNASSSRQVRPIRRLIASAMCI